MSLKPPIDPTSAFTTLHGVDARLDIVESRLFDVRSYMAPYVMDNTGVTVSGNAQAIQLAADTLSALYEIDGIPRTLFVPHGKYKLAKQGTSGSAPYAVLWPSGIGLLGEGSERGTQFIASADSTPFVGKYNAAAHVSTDNTFTNFMIDGAAQTDTGSGGSFNFFLKGMFFTHMLRAKWRNVSAVNCWGTGLGVDYLQRSSFTNCTANSNGRGLAATGTTAGGGGSGIGIGTGYYDIEDTTVVNCVCLSNGSNGVFWEQQPNAISLGVTKYSSGAQVIGGRFEGNYRGVTDGGVASMVVSGAHIVNNTDHGFYCGPTTGSNNGGKNGRISDCTITGNGGYGAYLYYGSGDQNGNYQVLNNSIRVNTLDGIHSTMIGSPPNVTIEGNECIANGESGIWISGTASTMLDWSVSNNKCHSNGQSGVSTRPYGIHFTVPTITRGQIERNACHENGSGTVANTQTYGLSFSGAVTLTNTRVRGNHLHTNVTGPILMSAATSGTTIITDNPPYNPVGISNLTVPASGATTTCGVQPTDYYFLGGTYTASGLTLNGTNILPGAVGAVNGTTLVRANPGDAIVANYTVAPVAVRQYKH